MKRVNLLKQLLTNNSGVSMKSFFMFVLTITGVFILLVLCFAIIWEVIYTNATTLDLTGFAAIIGAVGTLFATAGLTKVLGEKNERPTESNDDNE